jgi:hypothetical protein
VPPPPGTVTDGVIVVVVIAGATSDPKLRFFAIVLERDLRRRKREYIGIKIKIFNFNVALV